MQHCNLFNKMQMLESIFGFLLHGKKAVKPRGYTPGPPNLILATRALLREHTVYSQFAVDKAEHAYLQALEDGRSDERVAFLREEFEHRKARGKGYVVWVDGYMYPAAA